jgi:nucleoside-diphosphate-sugar epimerase
MTMRLLITGASGQIGGVLCKWLYDEYDIRGLDLRPPEGDAAAFVATVPTRREDEIEGARVGGPFTTEKFHRPAFGKSR